MGEQQPRLPLMGCICGDAFSDPEDYPGEVHYWSCPVRVRQGANAPHDDCIAIDEGIWKQVVQALKINGLTVWDNAGRPIPHG